MHQVVIALWSTTALALAAAVVRGPAALHGASRPLDGAHFLGFNVVNLQSGNFSTDSAYAAATAGALQAGTLRYPGGNLADFWYSMSLP
jgi:hypothetical protein